MAITDLRVAYLNCRGFTAETFSTVHDWLLSEQFDMVALAETWHTAALQSTRFHPLILAVSPVLEASPNAGHRPGGLVVFARPDLHSHCSVTTSAYSISVGYRQRSLRFVYFPPSLSLPAVTAATEGFSHTDVLMGDFNVSFTRPASTVLARRPLLTFWESYCRQHRLALCPPENGMTRWDHVWACPGVVSLVQQHDQHLLPFSTDHPMLCVRLGLPPLQQGSLTSSLPEHVAYRLRPLRTPSTTQKCTRALLQSAYQNTAAPLVSRHLAVIESELDATLADTEMSREDREAVIQAAVDAMDGILLDSVYHACDQVLDRLPTNRQHRPAMSFITPDMTVPSEVISGYKRLATSASRCTPWQSGVEGVSPLQDAHNRWSTYWTDERARAPTRIPRQRDAPAVDVDKVRRLISRQPWKSSHFDGVHASILKALSPTSLAHYLTRLYNVCLQHQTTPRRWNMALTVLEPKGDSLRTDDARPLSIVPLFRTLFERVLEQEMQPILARLDPAQAGFRQGGSVLENLHAADTDPCPIRVSVDYTKAYDSPDFDTIRLSWEIFGFPMWLLRVLSALYLEAMRCRLCVNGAYGEVIFRTKGFFQGTVLSPHLFNVYLNPLLQEMNDPVRVLRGYADDLLLLATSHAMATDLLARLYAWSTPRRLHINPGKSFVLGCPDIRLPSGDVIPSVERGKYLGLPLTASGIDWRHHFQSAIAQCSRHLHLMMHSTGGWSFTARALIFDVYVRPVLEYASDLFVGASLDANGNVTQYEDVWTELLSFQEKAACRIMQQSKFLPVFFRLLRWHPWHHRWHALALWHAYRNGYKHDTALPHLVRVFLADECSSPPAAHDRPLPSATLRARFEAFYFARVSPPSESIYRLDRHLSRSAQQHILHLAKHTFAYGAACLCGSPFSYRLHAACLPTPHGTLRALFDNADWPKIELTLTGWWSVLHP